MNEITKDCTRASTCMVELSIASNWVLSIFGTHETDSINSWPTQGLEGTFPACTCILNVLQDLRQTAINGVSSSEGGRRVYHVTRRCGLKCDIVVNAYGCLNITHDFRSNGHLPRIYTFIYLHRSCYIDPMKINAVHGRLPRILRKCSGRTVYGVE